MLQLQLFDLVVPLGFPREKKLKLRTELGPNWGSNWGQIGPKLDGVKPPNTHAYTSRFSRQSRSIRLHEIHPLPNSHLMRTIIDGSYSRFSGGNQPERLITAFNAGTSLCHPGSMQRTAALRSRGWLTIVYLLTIAYLLHRPARLFFTSGLRESSSVRDNEEWCYTEVAAGASGDLYLMKKHMVGTRRTTASVTQRYLIPRRTLRRANCFTEADHRPSKFYFTVNAEVCAKLMIDRKSGQATVFDPFTKPPAGKSSILNSIIARLSPEIRLRTVPVLFAALTAAWCRIKCFKLRWDDYRTSPSIEIDSTQ
ncbi:hypothetical protein B0H16DRAFT_1481357 [Mycena metata]|uniref:Uncharacterized protein n=1 Tax=Mycena metata TaxID=1033252 RepID=A0AAD7MB26_9AGAR|nr:hypothetical protein B0H16DRAFT_1481357 [Mycena metata]